MGRLEKMSWSTSVLSRNPEAKDCARASDDDLSWNLEGSLSSRHACVKQ